MKYLSLFSGIEAASLAFGTLGWEPLAFAEMEPFPNAVLAARWPDVPNLGDVTDVDWETWLDQHGRPDVVIAGSPCQAFSVAGNRRSLADVRGNLTLFTAELVRLLEPRFFVWENVPGALSTKDNAFGCLLGELVGAGEPLSPSGKRWTNSGLVSGPEARACWRVLDAQYFGVAQRRRRLFLVRCPRDGADPAEVLLERESLFGDPAPRREARTRPAGGPPAGARGGDLLADTGVVRGLKARFGTSGSDLDDAEAGHLVPDVSFSLSARQERLDASVETFCFETRHYTRGQGGAPSDVAPCLKVHASGGPGDAEPVLVAPTGPWWDGSDVSECLDSSKLLKQQTMPDKGRFAAVVEPFCFKVRGGVERSNGKKGGEPGQSAGKGYLERENGAFTVATSHDQWLAQPITPEVADPISSSEGKTYTHEGEHNFRMHNVVADERQPIGFYSTGGTHGVSAVEDGSPAIKVGSGCDIPSPPAVAFAENVRGEVRDCGDLAVAVSGGGGKPGQGYPAVMTQEPTVLEVRGREDGRRLETRADGTANCLRQSNGGRDGMGVGAIQSGMAVRRLTPRECERLQGMPDDHTRIPWRGKPAEDCPDGPRYKAIGNSMAVPVIRWLGRRVEFAAALDQD